MSFSGKKFRRTGGSNLDDFFRASKAPEECKKMLLSNAPVWSYTILSDNKIKLDVEMDGGGVTGLINAGCHQQVYTLGVEQELTKLDGSKTYMTFTLDGDNVLRQRVRKTNGVIAQFKREFYERSATMTISIEGTDVRKAHIFYELVED